MSDIPAGTPLDLLPGLTERNIAGKISLIIEGMPVGGTLSAGTNNWDNTWSLKTEDLKNLQFISCEGDDKDHTLTVRVLRYDADGFDVATTAALYDVTVEPSSAAVNGTQAPGAAGQLLAEAEARWE
ncbi:MAG: hypothetical protein IID55_14585, partial [Proteobacteria bacterium]|nr:hypothetical protein [Pseudomonadota bacterium]